MYRAESRKTSNGDEEETVYGIADENRFYCDFTKDSETALAVAKLLNEAEAEACHVLEIIEDMFYS